MSLRGYLVGLVICTLFSLAALGLIIVYLNPEIAGFLGLLLFYLSLFFCLSCLFSLIGFYLRKRFSQAKTSLGKAHTSFWQGLIFALIIIIILVLQKYAR